MQVDPAPAPALTPALTPASPGATLHHAFAQLCDAAHGPVWAVIRQYRPAEPDHVWDEVRARVWTKFPSMYAQEQLDLAAGRLSRHKWISWVVTIATNYLIDLHRRKHGRHSPRPAPTSLADGPAATGAPTAAGATAHTAAGTAANTAGATQSDSQPCVTPTGTSGARRQPVVCVPLHAEKTAAMPSAANPETFAALHEGWQLVNHLIHSLPADERDAVVALIEKVDDDEVAARWRVSTRTIRRRRAQALERMRLHLASQGYEHAADLRVA